MKAGTYKHPPEVIAKIVAERRARRAGPFKGRKHSLKTRVSMSLRHYEVVSREGYEHPRKGRKGQWQSYYELMLPRF